MSPILNKQANFTQQDILNNFSVNEMSTINQFVSTTSFIKQTNLDDILSYQTAQFVQ